MTGGAVLVEQGEREYGNLHGRRQHGLQRLTIEREPAVEGSARVDD